MSDMKGWIGDVVVVESGNGRNFTWPVVGTGHCSKCGEPILWCETHGLKKCPVDIPADDESDTVSHFVTCPNAKEFRR